MFVLGGGGREGERRGEEFEGKSRKMRMEVMSQSFAVEKINTMSFRSCSRVPGKP